ncbi:acyl--CoA ligase [candidate division KSB1 bacterium]|nr:acyl--CoA ligase [candidate division KSB1 bacterium]
MDRYLIHQFLEHSAAILPEKTAIIHKDKIIDYQTLNERANQLANFFLEKGIQKGDRIAILLENSIHYVISYFAILKIGAIEVSLNATAGADSLKFILKDCQVSAIIAADTEINFIQSIQSELADLKVVIFEEKNLETACSLMEIFERYDKILNPVKIIDLDLASIVYTSGSTGKPRGVMLSHLNLVHNTCSIIRYLGLGERDSILVVLPFYYIYGKSLLNTHIYVGGTIVIENRFAFPNVVIQAMKKYQVTGFSGVPSTFTFLLNRSTFSQENFPDLRYITQAGGAMAPVITSQLMKLLKDKQIFIMYGATEAAARIAYLEPSMLAKKLGSIGNAIPNVEIMILNEKGEKCQPDEVGEIVVRGSNIMSGYWNDPVETASVLKADGYHTGDLARMDADGNIYVVGRKKDMIKCGAHRISAQEIEAILLQNPHVYEAAVIGVSDELLGEAIKAFVVPTNGTDNLLQEFKNFCREKLPSFKMPKYFEVMDALPKNASGKIMKEELRKMV